MGGKRELYRRSSLIFFSLGVVALGLQLAGALLPFWYKDDWLRAASLSTGLNSTGEGFRVYQGPWSDYICLDMVEERGEGEDPESTVSYRDCRIQLHDDTSGVIPHLMTLRGVEVTSLALGFLSSLGCLGVFVTAGRHSCAGVTSQVCFTLPSLVAGLCSLVAVLMVAGDVEPGRLYWALTFPTLAGCLWFFNGAFSFVVCRYDPHYGRGDPVAPSAEGAGLERAPGASHTRL